MTTARIAPTLPGSTVATADAEEHGPSGGSQPVAIRRRLLFIAFDFPPLRTSAVYRLVGLTRFLWNFGYDVTVLSANPRPGDIQDPTLLGKLPARIRFERTNYWRLDAWENMAGKASRSLTLSAAAPVDTGGSRPKPALTKLRQRVHSVLHWGAEWVRSFLYFPDFTAGWIPLGLARAIDLQLNRRFDVIYTSSPPKSAPVIGMMMKLLFGVPWVCEFRDPWYPPKRSIRRRMERWVQSRIVRHADRIVVISKGNAEDLVQKFRLPADKIVVVPNGYDEDDFSGLDKESRFFEPGYIHLSHFGTVYPNFAGEFYPAVCDLLRERPELRGRLRVNIVGFPDGQTEELAAGELRDVLRLYPFIPHREALQAMMESDCLLLFLSSADTSRLSGLGKIYWYLRVGRPVLAISPTGGAQELVDEAQAGWVVNDRESILRTLREVTLTPANGQPPAPRRPQFVEQFRYDRIAARLAVVLDEALRA